MEHEMRELFRSIGLTDEWFDRAAAVASERVDGAPGIPRYPWNPKWQKFLADHLKLRDDFYARISGVHLDFFERTMNTPPKMTPGSIQALNSVSRVRRIALSFLHSLLTEMMTRGHHLQPNEEGVYIKIKTKFFHFERQQGFSQPSYAAAGDESTAHTSAAAKRPPTDAEREKTRESNRKYRAKKALEAAAAGLPVKKKARQQQQLPGPPVDLSAVDTRTATEIAVAASAGSQIVSSIFGGGGGGGGGWAGNASMAVDMYYREGTAMHEVASFLHQLPFEEAPVAGLTSTSVASLFGGAAAAAAAAASSSSALNLDLQDALHGSPSMDAVHRAEFEETRREIAAAAAAAAEEAAKKLSKQAKARQYRENHKQRVAAATTLAAAAAAASSHPSPTDHRQAPREFDLDLQDAINGSNSMAGMSEAFFAQQQAAAAAAEQSAPLFDNSQDPNEDVSHALLSLSQPREDDDYYFGAPQTGTGGRYSGTCDVYTCDLVPVPGTDFCAYHHASLAPVPLTPSSQCNVCAATVPSGKKRCVPCS